MRVQQGDSVVVISGKYKGKTGTILRVLKAKGRVVVSDVNIRKKHMKASPQRPGQIVEYEASIDASNVMLVDAKTKKRTRIGFSKDAKGKTQRIAKKSGEPINKTAPKASRTTEKTEAVSTKKSSSTKKEPKVETKKTEKTEKKEEQKKASQPFWRSFMGGGKAVSDDDNVDTSADVSQQKDQSTRTRSAQRGS